MAYGTLYVSTQLNTISVHMFGIRCRMISCWTLSHHWWIQILQKWARYIFWLYERKERATYFSSDTENDNPHISEWEW